MPHSFLKTEQSGEADCRLNLLPDLWLGYRPPWAMKTLRVFSEQLHHEHVLDFECGVLSACICVYRRPKNGSAPIPKMIEPPIHADSRR